jgi:predicted TIM-barrel fold metal-dependent hydrolase
MPGRVIFGSDWPLFDLAYPYHHWVRFVKEEDWASAKVREEVMGATMRKLLQV